MAELTDTLDAAQQQLWAQLEKTRICMLWVRDSAQHPQPMTMFADAETGAIWFITSSDTDLAADIGHGAEAAMTVVSPNQDFHASLRGSLVQYDSAEKLDEVWNLATSAWFEEGREDPKVMLLKMSPAEASVWFSQGNPVMVGLKLLRAAVKTGESQPALGTHHVLHLDRAA